MIQKRINTILYRHPRWRVIINGIDDEFRGLEDLMVTVREGLVSIVDAQRYSDRHIASGIITSLLIEDDSPDGDGQDCISMSIVRQDGEIGVTLEPEDGVWESDGEGFEFRTVIAWNGDAMRENRPSDEMLDWYLTA